MALGGKLANAVTAGIGHSVASGLVNGLNNMAKYAGAGQAANAVSKAAQSAQGAFNQNSANIANGLGGQRLTDQYGFNAGQAAMANDFSSAMWDKAAEWNENMFERQMEFNAQEAQKQRDWQERLLNTAYQRATADMAKAGLNPILAVTGGGINTGTGGGSAASVSAPSMGSIGGAMASGGLLNGISASEGNYQGQMEYYAQALGLLGSALGGISSALGAFGNLGTFGKEFASGIASLLTKNDAKPLYNSSLGRTLREASSKILPDKWNGLKNGYRNGIKWDRN